jgi:integrative and conjugative element protein (TIGR02256 family)
MPSVPRPLDWEGILIPKALHEDLLADRLAHLPRETGGFLIGQRRGPHIEVTTATRQAVDDVATRVSFERADPSHTNLAVDAWTQDGGLSGLVGDWHSHPTGGPHPSGLDERAWRKLATAERAPVVGLILGEGSTALYLARLRWMRFTVVRCDLVEETEIDLVFRARSLGGKRI